MFKVGDIIIGIEGNKYSVTSKGVKCKVVSILNSDRVSVKLVDGRDVLTYTVEAKWFALAEEEAVADDCEERSSEYDLQKAEEDFEDLLYRYDYSDYISVSSLRHLSTIVSNQYGAKTRLREILRRHPNWDEEQQAIIFKSHIETGINTYVIRNFGEWLIENMKFKYSNVPNAIDEIKTKMHNILELCKANQLPFDDLRLNYYSSEQLDKFKEAGEANNNKRNEIRKYIYDWVNLIYESKATPEFVEATNELFPEVKAVVGQKTSRIVNKICKILEVDGIKEMGTTFNGEAKDYGFNYRFAEFADAINPIEITKYTVISINLIDFLDMSNGTNWRSCHTMDIFNDDGDGYHGQYSSGTLSYALDPSTIIMYTVDEKYEGKMCYAEKDRRMNFHLNEDGNSFVFGRLYPDGRDGGEKGMAAQFRNIFQKVISECLDEANYWKVHKGSSSNREVIEDTRGTNYQDYFCYEDTGNCYRIGTERKTKIKIGHNPICPSCGTEHSRTNNIFCYDCMRQDGENNDDYDHYCTRCGDGFYDSNDEAIYCEDNGNWYCCERCAENDGVYYCQDDGYYHDEYNCYWDDGYDAYHSGEPDVTTVSGLHFYTCEEAEDSGCVEIDGEWYSKEDVVYDEYSGEAILKEDAIKIDGNWFSCEEHAEEFGYRMNDNGDWVLTQESDAV